MRTGLKDRNSLIHLCIFTALLTLVVVAFTIEIEGVLPEEPTSEQTPRIRPAYKNVVIPPNIAPLNFRILEPGSEFHVTISSTNNTGEHIEISTEKPDISIPLQQWRRLLSQQSGNEIKFVIRARNTANTWKEFQPIINRVATDSIDSHLVYRLLKPLYNKYVHMGIYQRDLSNFEESPILENRYAENVCINCHTFHQNKPDPMLLEVRDDQGSPILIARGDEVETIDTRTDFHYSPATYATWHPDGQHVCYSLNNATLFFHTDPRKETREVFDATSELVVYSLEKNTVTTTPEISSEEFAETWPEWSADGRHLYFSSTQVTPIEQFTTVRYDLMRIAYNAKTEEWGKLETVISADEAGMSVLQPKASPDGRYLVCTMADHGNFPIFLESSDLYVLDLQNGKYRRLDINSDQVDSWHSWSSNSRWLVFSSKRLDGLFARPFITYVDTSGRFHPPVLLPQENPDFYDSFIQTVNVPVLVNGRIEVDQRTLANAITSPREITKVRLDSSVATKEIPPGSNTSTEPYSSGSYP